MLSERHYTSYHSGNSYWSGKNCILILIAINVAAFILVLLSGRLAYEFALSSDGIAQFKLWQFVTYMFIHAGLWHILLNMWGLYLFGTTILPMLGTTRFLTLYFLSGVSGAGLWLLLNWNSRGVLVGASGGVFGVMMAAAMLYPNMRIHLLFPPIPLTMKTLVIVYAVIELINELSNIQGGIAHLAHLGGFISAYFYIKSLYRDQVWDIFDFLASKKRKTSFTSKLPKGWKVYTNSTPHEPVSKEELNRILDKISAHGMNSLTDEEMATLKRASNEMKNKRVS